MLILGHKASMKLIAFLCLLSVASQLSALAEEKPLSGHVKKDATRLARPALQTGVAGFSGGGTIQSTDFAFGAAKSVASPQPETPTFAPTPIHTSAPLFHSGATTTPVAPPKPPPSTTGGGSEPNYDYGKKAKVDYKKIVIRLKRFRASQEMEVMWEAARMGNRMLKKGADVTILLDMEAVHAADKNDTAFASMEANRGNGNGTAEKLTTPQQHLTEFAANGGHLVANARWVRLFSIQGGSLIPGTVIATEDEVDDLLMEPNATVIDY